MPAKRAKKSSKPTWPTIRRRGNSWQVDCGKTFGSRLRKTFADRQEAEAFAEAMRSERRSLKAMAVHERKNRSVSLANLSDTQRADVLQAFDLLQGQSLLGAVRFYLDHTAKPMQETTVETLFDSWLAEKAERNRRPRTVANARRQMESFVFDHRDRPAHEITSADVKSWLATKPTRPASRNTYIRAVTGLFRYGVHIGAVDASRDPTKALGKVHEDETRPGILSTADVRRLLSTAAALHPEMVPHLALGIFAGLRPENELRLLDWKDIDLDAGTIRVDPASAKKRRQRFVEISDNLRAWLLPYAKPEGRVFFSRRYLREIREAAKVEWSHDCMRHTYASNHVAFHQDAAKTASQLGHAGSVDVLHNHYRQLVKPADARAFWQIDPPSEGKIIRMRTA